MTDVLAPLPSLPRLSLPVAPITKAVSVVLLPGILLGMLTAVRILGPLAGALVILAFMLQPQRRSWLPIGFYLGVAGVTALACWPYLWPEPAVRFAEVLRHMADNPKLLPVLYAGTVYASNDLPAGYLPRLLALTLTEPIWPLAIGGLVVSGVRVIRRQIDWRTWVPIVLWLVLPYAYVVTQRPAMYDGYRHFLFMLPPIFIGCGLALDALWSRLRNPAGQVALGALLLVPGLLGVVRLHPYPYTYYNQFIGGVGGAFRSYETDYWLTCYKETLEALDDAGRRFRTALRSPAARNRPHLCRDPMAHRSLRSGRRSGHPGEPAPAHHTLEQRPGHPSDGPGHPECRPAGSDFLRRQAHP